MIYCKVWKLSAIISQGLARDMFVNRWLVVCQALRYVYGVFFSANDRFFCTVVVVSLGSFVCGFVKFCLAYIANMCSYGLHQSIRRR